MQVRRMLGDLRPGHLRPAAPLALHLLLPRVPLSDARHRHERGEILIPALRAREKRRRMSVDDDLRADDRLHGILADHARVVRVLRDRRAHRMLERRHRLDRELRDAAQIRGISNP